MEMRGTGVRLQPGDLQTVTAEFGLTEAHARTVMEVETSGKGFDALGWVEFLFEPHLFYRNCPRDKLQTAIQQGLAYPQWRGPGSYPKGLQLRHQQFEKAMALDETAAIKSASWGLGQILGSECVEAGYTSPQEMLEGYKLSELNQVKSMLILIKHRGLDKDLLNFPDMQACTHFAVRYNGKGEARNNYHNKLHDAYVKWSGRQQTHAHTDPAPDGTVRFGDRDSSPEGGSVWKIQSELKAIGHSLEVDGNFGPGTRAAILAWKANEGMDTSTPDMSLADQEMLKQAQPMPVQKERADATVTDLKPKSVIIQKSSLGKKIIGWFGGLTTGASVLSNSVNLDTAQSAVDKANQAKGIVNSTKDLINETGFASLLHFVNDWKFVILIVGAGIGFFLFNQVQQKRLEMHQKAEIA